MSEETTRNGAKRRYVVSFAVDATEAEAQDIAVAVATAVDCQHVGPISVSESERFSWEDDRG